MIERVKAGMFDRDDNITTMPTKATILVEEDGRKTKRVVTPREFRQLGERGEKIKPIKEGDSSQSVVEQYPGFFNLIDDATFQEEAKRAIEDEQFGPAEIKLRKGVIDNQELAINSNRGHSSAAVKEVMATYIRHILDRYGEQHQQRFLRSRDIQRERSYRTRREQIEAQIEAYLAEKFHAYMVFGDEFTDRFDLRGENVSGEQRKILAYKHWTSHLREKYGPNTLISVGMSEDTENNLVAIRTFVKNEVLQDSTYDNMNFAFYLTRYEVGENGSPEHHEIIKRRYRDPDGVLLDIKQRLQQTLR